MHQQDASACGHTVDRDIWAEHACSDWLHDAGRRHDIDAGCCDWQGWAGNQMKTGLSHCYCIGVLAVHAWSCWDATLACAEGGPCLLPDAYHAGHPRHPPQAAQSGVANSHSPGAGGTASLYGWKLRSHSALNGAGSLSAAVGAGQQLVQIHAAADAGHSVQRCTEERRPEGRAVVTCASVARADVGEAPALDDTQTP